MDAESVAPLALEHSPIVAAESTEALPAVSADASISSEPSRDITPDVGPIVVERAPIVDLAADSSVGSPDVGNASSCTALANVEPVIADDAAVAVADTLDHAEVPDVSISNDPNHDGNADAEPVAVGEAAIGDTGGSSPEVLADIAGDEPPCGTVIDVEPVLVDTSPAAPIELAEVASADCPAVSTGNELNDSGTANAEPVAAGGPAIDNVAESLPETLADIFGDEASGSTVTEVEPVTMETSAVASIELTGTAPVDCPDANINSDTAASEAVTVESAPASMVEAATETPVTASITSNDEPPALSASSAPETRDIPRAAARAAEPVDRATLIRRRWAETGIRMWNPRLHGTGEAALNIQGRIELLPPAPGEKMPRYDKLEFRMLGGQIVCEGVIVEAPAHAGQRSFTTLTERRQPERAREAVPA